MKFLRDFDEKGHELAKIQGRIFRKSSLNNFPSFAFVKAFSYLDEVETMDDLSFLFMYVSEGEIYYRTTYKINNMNRGEIINPYVMEWIGYFLRTFCYLTKISSKKAFEKIPFSYLKGVYLPYHSLDIRLAVIKVIEDLNIVYNENSDEKLMRILRETR